MPAFLVAIPLVEHRARLVPLVAGFVESVVADVRLAGAVEGAAASVVGGHDGCIAGWLGECVVSGVKNVLDGRISEMVSRYIIYFWLW